MNYWVKEPTTTAITISKLQDAAIVIYDSSRNVGSATKTQIAKLLMKGVTVSCFTKMIPAQFFFFSGERQGK